MIVAPNNPIPLKLRNRCCANCGYALDGLTVEIDCPECGREQDEYEIVLRGYTRGQYESIENARISRVWLIVLMTNVGWLSNILMHPHSNASRLVGIIGLCAVGVTLLRRFAAQQPGTQIRLYSRGFMQLERAGRPGAFEVMQRSNTWIVWLMGIVLLTIWFALSPTRTREDTMIFSFGMLTAVFFAAAGRRSAKLFRLYNRAIPENALADYFATFVQPIHWRNTGGFCIDPVRGPRYRLQIWDTGKVPGHEKQEATRYLADLEFEIEAEKVEPLRTLIRSWIIQARSGEVYAKMAVGKTPGSMNIFRTPRSGK